MLRGIYTAASGMVAAQLRQDIITNNLVNADTAGYKQDRVLQGAFPTMLLSRLEGGTSEKIGYLGTGSRIEGQWTDYTPGHLRETGNPLDLAITGEGFFVVQTPAGNRYTRQGHFLIDNQGYLVTRRGDRVMGSNGPVRLQPGAKVLIDDLGNVLQQGEVVDRLQVVTFNDLRNLIKEGDGLFASGGEEGQPVEAPELKPGYLEGSNVNLVHEMTKMIEAVRYYQLNQKLITLQDETLGKAVNEVGKLG